jgi:DNA-directed RNA polymerase subunit RPC12/RpoP
LLANGFAIFLFGVGACVVGVSLLVWATLSDRGRGRRRCPKCWHWLEGVPSQDDGSFVCPECGRRALNEQRLFRRRIRVRWLVFASILIVVGLAGATWPFVRSNAC